MKLTPSGIGAEPKKLAFLGGILLLAGGTYYWNSRTDVPAGATPSPAPAVKTPALPAPSASRTTTASYGPRTAGRSGRVGGSGDDFRPTLKLPEGMDVSTINPMLKLDLLDKLRGVSVEGGSR